MRTSITAGFLGWMICTVAVGQDINGDGVLDCADTELLGDAIGNGDMDSRFDLDGNGIVELADHKVWQDAVYADRDPLGYEDLNLDNVIDQRDGLIYALNFNVEQPYGHCRGDTNLDGVSTRVENDLNYYTTGITLPFDSSPTTVREIGNPLLAWTEQGVLIAESAAFRLVAVPQVAPDHFMSSKVVVQTNNPDDVVAMIHNLAFTGDAHQVRFPGPFGSPTRSSSDFEPGAFWDEAAVEQLKPLDSHFLIDQSYISYGLYSSFSGTIENHDLSNPTGFVGPIAPIFDIPYEYGLGNLQSGYPDFDLFSFRESHRTGSLDFAQMVTPARMPDTDKPGQVTIQLGVGGATSGGALPIEDFPVFGLDQPLYVPFFAAPCDTDADGVCDLSDLERLERAFGREDAPEFDLDISGTIDIGDTRVWVTWYESQSGNTLLDGDSDLDGDVDAADLNRVGLHWLMENGGLSGGDFDHDGVTDSTDLNIIGAHWQRVRAAPVPEPAVGIHFLLLWLALCNCGFRRPVDTR